MKVLMAEDDIHLGKIVSHMLKKENVEVDWVTRGEEVYDYIRVSHYDVLLLDWLMPGESGLQVCIHLRKENYQGAIIILTAKDNLDDKVKGLTSGADDYLVKPFEFAELYARLQALTRRSNQQIPQDIIQIGDLTINRLDKTVSKTGIIIQLTAKEFQILDILAQNYGHVVPREVIIERVWGISAEITSNNLDAHVHLLRKKVDQRMKYPLIQSIRGVGYKMEDKSV
jgi:DNA-binding response OmpR family regulator